MDWDLGVLYNVDHLLVAGRFSCGPICILWIEFVKNLWKYFRPFCGQDFDSKKLKLKWWRGSEKEATSQPSCWFSRVNRDIWCVVILSEIEPWAEGESLNGRLEREREGEREDFDFYLKDRNVRFFFAWK